MILRTWVSKKFINKLETNNIQVFVSALLLAMAGYMIMHG